MTSQVAVGQHRALVVAAVGLIAACGYVVAVVSAAGRGYDVFAVLVTAPVLVAISVPLMKRAVRAEDDPRLAQLLVAGLVLKLAASLVRYEMAFDVYDGVADAAGYVGKGAAVASSLWAGNFAIHVPGEVPGTGFVQLLTGVVFTLTGPSSLAGFLVFSWFGFWGLYLFYRAFVTAFPDGDRLRYALLAFFVPSLLFWPSSIGKEAWMTLALGLAAYGTARVLNRSGGYLLLATGVAAAGMVRPHVALLICVGLLVGYLHRPAAGPASPARPVLQVAGLAALLVASLAVLNETEAFFGVTEEGAAAADEVFEEVQERTTQGGSEFRPVTVRSPVDVPVAAVTVLFRPFPSEAHNPQSLAAALEGVLLLGLAVASTGRLLRLPRTAWRRPYVLFAAVYVLLFVVAFSNIGNFGILTRQRTQLLPLFFVLLAIPGSGAGPAGETPVAGRATPRQARPALGSQR